MKKLLLRLIFILLCVSCDTINKESQQLPRIAIAGIAIESSTFSPAQTHIESFHPVTGDTIFNSYPFLAPDSLNRNRASWYPTLRGRSLPGGIVTREAYETMVVKTLTMLKENAPYDGLFFDIPILYILSSPY